MGHEGQGACGARRLNPSLGCLGQAAFSALAVLSRVFL
ncbi:hypothetical protein RD1_3322 [Roseobacter denitrificans OCh 114]|uniref:Uncharacterized protein n=1 Tax=Roseobacter denitrificans (strain ATCC 33942 / OCh 114) TaxID=375451 RepID=Q163M2_ROSDO|nr:hypothetical protein RD1_3322 [Roseobacter denitrificans OCh 114]